MTLLTRPSTWSSPADRRWRFWFTLPIYPFSQRRTICQDVVPGEIWTFEQLQGVLYVVTPIRMTIVRLAAGGLLVYAPVAPTPECLGLVQTLVEASGAVKYILLPTASGLEHKVFAGPFARCFPQAQVYVVPHQWSFPVNLPLAWLGLPWGRTQMLPQNAADTPFGDEFDYAILGPIGLGLGAFEEVAVLHRASRTVLVTDAVVAVPVQPPAIVADEVRALLFHARDQVDDVVADTPENRLKGWQRIALFSFYFRPSAAPVVDWVQALRDRARAADRSRENYFGLYPFRWRADWQASFEALRGGGRLFVAPILQRLILNRQPQATLDWVDRVASWQFERIIPCHLAAPIAATPQDFRQAFAFLQQQPAYPVEYPLPEADLALLNDLEAILDRARITPPAQEKV